MPRRNDIAKILLFVGVFALQAFSAPQTVSSLTRLINKQNAVMLFDVDEGTVLARHPLEMKFFASYSIPESKVKALRWGCHEARAEGEGMSIRAVTDGDGSLVLNGIPAGQYLVRVEAEGFTAFSDCIIVGDAGKSECKNYFYFRVSKKLPFFAGDVLDGGCRPWVPDPCASLHAEHDRQYVSNEQIKIAYLDGSPASHVEITLTRMVRTKNLRQLQARIASLFTDRNGAADLSRLYAAMNEGHRYQLTIRELQRGVSTAVDLRSSPDDAAAPQKLVLFQRGCEAKKSWNIEVVQ